MAVLAAALRKPRSVLGVSYPDRMMSVSSAGGVRGDMFSSHLDERSRFLSDTQAEN